MADTGFRKESILASTYISEYDPSSGTETATLDPISQAIDDMVEPGEDASVSTHTCLVVEK